MCFWVDVIGLEDIWIYYEVLVLIKELGYLCYLVYEKDVDKIVGILYVKDLLMYCQEVDDFVWQELIWINVLFVLEFKKINDLFSDF